MPAAPSPAPAEPAAPAAAPSGYPHTLLPARPGSPRQTARGDAAVRTQTASPAAPPSSPPAPQPMAPPAAATHPDASNFLPRSQQMPIHHEQGIAHPTASDRHH